MRPSFEESHEAPCWGGHDATIACDEAERTRNAERKALFVCPQSETRQHSFNGDTFCSNGCGRHIQELVPEARVGDDE